MRALRVFFPQMIAWALATATGTAWWALLSGSSVLVVPAAAATCLLGAVALATSVYKVVTILDHGWERVGWRCETCEAARITLDAVLKDRDELREALVTLRLPPS